MRTPAIELVYFEGCPHADEARRNLGAALRRFGLPSEWVTWDLRDAGTPRRLMGYGSPTVLVAGRDVLGLEPENDPHELACRVLDLVDTTASYESHDLYLHQELINDKPIGPGTPQPSDHCPTSPGQWYPGSGRATGTSNVFGNLTETEVYCINADRAELSGGLATWIDSDGDSIFMTFGAKLLKGFAYPAAPSAPLIGFAQFTGGTGKWTGLTGAALFTGKQNGDGTASIDYRGTVYVPD